MTITDEAEKLVFTIGGDIRDYFNKYPLDEIYTYNFTVEDVRLFRNDEIKRINNLKNGFEKNKLLKIILSDKLSIAEDKLPYYNWIVKQWGGIKNFEKTIDDIEDFFMNINNKKLISKYYNSISSYSKIISFTKPDEYFIFDSRVAYVLNWLLLKNYKSENNFFIIPPGRNSDLVKYNMDTIINLYEKGGSIKYYEKKYLYFIYCEFVKKLFKENDNIEKPYYVEMMLFGLFDKICAEIKTKVKIIIV